MDQNTIELSGIVRNLPDNRVADGTMQEIINLRPLDGAWRPVGPKESIPMAAADIWYIHTVNEAYKIYWGTPGGVLYYWVYENGILQATVSTNINLTGKQIAFTQLHKTVILSNKTDRTMVVFVFDVDTERYRMFNEGFPDVPRLWFFSDIDSDTNNYSLGVSGRTPDEILADGLVLIAHWLDKYPYGPLAIRYAWELADGSIVKPSSPKYLTTSVFQTTAGDPNIVMASLQGGLRIGTYEDTPSLTQIKNDYMGLIRALNVYITSPVTPITGTEDDANGIHIPVFPELNLITKDQFYLIHSIPLDRIDASETWSVEGGAAVYLPGPFKDLETRTSMGADNFTHHQVSGKNLMAYNDRIFIGDITTKVSLGYMVPEFILPNGNLYTGPPYRITFQVDVFTSDGIRTVEQTWYPYNYYLSDGVTPSFKFNRYFSYPDARARILRIYVRLGTSADHYLVATLSLTPNELLNFSWYNGQTIEGDETIYGKYTFTGPLSNYPIAVPLPISRTYYDPNRIQLTEQSNPFYYPAINSYRIGNGSIIGMATNAMALSQGQFGQFPVYCFTTDGIWAMTIGSGDPLIQSIVPVSREVCNNYRSITQIDGGVLFVTAKGLYVLSGASPIELSELAEGNHLSRLTGTVNYEALANNPNLYQVKSYLCNTNFLTFLAGADIGYDHINKEIVVSNPTKTYSWVYSMRSKMWFKISQSWERFVADFPHAYGYSSNLVPGTTPFLASSTDISASDDTVLASAEYIEGALYNYLFNISKEDFSELVPVHMESRPIKISARRFKKIHRLLVGGVVNDSLSNPFSVNLFGSADDRDWFLMNASHAFAARNRLLIGRTTFSCMYFILVIGGRVDEDAYFTHVDIEFEERFGNKLR